MLHSIFGRKIGMTQIFDENKRVVPVTVIDTLAWYVTQVKTPDVDGYAAVQIGLPRKKYRDVAFSSDWLKAKSRYFEIVREIACDDTDASLRDIYTLGKKITLQDVSFAQGGALTVVGTSSGKGFQGVVKRWNFGGGPATHGSTFHRAPGAIGSLRTQGEVIKGKRLPGHMGNRRLTVKGLKLVHMDKEAAYLFVQGAVPGKKNSLVLIRKQG